MSRFDYSRDDLRSAIAAVGIRPGDVVSLQVSLGRLGRPRDVAPTMQGIAALVIDTFLEALGDAGTLIVPTYTYSIGRGEVYEVETTPSGIGEFGDLFRRRPGVIRSRDPMLSSAGVGPRAAEILRDLSRSCYGPGSTYDRLHAANARICTLGLAHHWATYRHYIEEAAAVPFRFHKCFYGVVRECGLDSHETWVYFAAPLVDRCQPMGMPLEAQLRRDGKLRAAPIGRAEILSIGAAEFFDEGRRAFARDPWLTAKGPPCSTAELVRLEDERVGARRPEIVLGEPSAAGLLAALSPLQRDIVSDGVDAALDAIAAIEPLQVHRFPSGRGTAAGVVPEKWTLRGGTIEAADGATVLSTARGDLSVASYSHPIDCLVAAEELHARLHSHALPHAIPVLSVAGTRDWRLGCAAATRPALMDSQYHVRIDAAFSFGSLSVGELVVQGRRAECVYLVADILGAKQANAGVSGAVAILEVIRALRRRPAPHYTYRAVLAPGEIGIAAYLEAMAGTAAGAAGGFVVAMVGRNRPLRITPPTLDGSVPGRLARVTRGTEGARPFDEFRSDADQPSLISWPALHQTVTALLSEIDALEQRGTATATSLGTL
ncbi:MAG TPA: DUF4910 domain-containing protein [Vicinamibacterales bacterium]|nr:DUF4910 domain-containing protein [Vicinamibacterales bacterium]